MAFWNRKRGDEKKGTGPSAHSLALSFVRLHDVVEKLRVEVDRLHNRVNAQPVPTNDPPHAGSAVQDWLPVVDRMQELLLVQMGNADLAQAFGTYARQRELRASEGPPDTTWTERNESTYENL